MPRPAADALAALEAHEAALRAAIWRGDELAAVVDLVKSELIALHRSLARAEETIAELTDIGDAAQLAIDQLRSDLAARDKVASEAVAQRDAIAAELFRLAGGDQPIAAAEAVAQRDALASEFFRLTCRAERGGLSALFRRLLRGRARRHRS